MRTLAISIALLSAACASRVAASRMNARVLALQPNMTAAPVEGAHLLMSCPDGFRRELGVTGSDGELRLAPPTAPALHSTRTAGRRGYQADSTPVARVGPRRAADTCTATELQMLLLRS